MQADLTIQRIHTIFEGEHNPGQMHNPGRHSDCFVYYDEGEADYQMNGYSFRARKNDLFFLAKGSVYDIHILQKSRFICLDFDFSPSMDIRKSCLFRDASPTVRNRFTAFFHLWAQNNTWQLPRAYSILYDIYAEAIRSESKQYAKRSPLLEEATAYILAHYTEPDLSIAAIAAHSGISEVHLRRLFRESMGCSPIGYIHLLRMEKAKNMLRASNYSISEVALSVGYPDPYYFSRLFREKIGLPPLVYRNRI
ncbi:MAG: helix-turn-helix domain-containing protein [Clostridia bacterium]|nr:helix-turn-helix domain-containing protein [Clostridia bacterium]